MLLARVGGMSERRGPSVHRFFLLSLRGPGKRKVCTKRVREVSSKGVRVNAVAPGPIGTDLVMALSEGWRKAKAAELPLGYFGVPEDVAATVAFLASEDAKIYVGQTLGPNSGDVML